MAFKVADILGISGFVDYAACFDQAKVDVGITIRTCPLEATEEQVIAAAADADAVIAVLTFMPFSRWVLQNLPKCRFVMSLGIGYDKLDVDAATEFGVLAANVPDTSVEDVSDHTMALILACTRRVVELNQVVKQGGWKTAGGDPQIQAEIWPKLSRLRGQTLGLVGFGRIAQAVMHKARGFGMRIIAYDPYVTEEPFLTSGAERVSLDRLLAESDVVSLHTPLTASTTRLLGMEQLQKMKASACLVNTARGAVIDHQALYEVLSQKKISAAAVDVTEPEPLPVESPLLKLANFMVTAHSAGISPAAFAEMQRRPAEEIIRVVKGEWPVGLINPQVKDRYRLRWRET